MKRILLLEDDVHLAKLLTHHLKKHDIEVRHQTNRKDALKELEKSDVDVLVSDVMLPHLGGLDFADAVKKDPLFQDKPVVIITGMDRGVIEATKNEADEILYKPFQAKELVEVIERLAA